MKPPSLVDGKTLGIAGVRKLPPREFARVCAKHGLGFLGSAFNYENNPAVPYRFPDSLRDRFVELAAQILDIIEHGEIIELPHVAARNDPAFNEFMSAVLKPPRRQRKRPGSPL